MRASAPTALLLLGAASAQVTHDARPFVRNRAFSDVDAYFSRLPSAAAGAVPPEVWALAQDPAGQYLQFATNSSSLAINLTLGSAALDMWHFPSSGCSGVDLYAFDEQAREWRWLATPRPQYPFTAATLFDARESVQQLLVEVVVLVAQPRALLCQLRVRVQQPFARRR